MQVYGEEQVNTYTNNNQYNPQVTTLSDGSYVVVWESYSQSNINVYSIHGQRFSANGIPVGGEFLVSPQGVGNQTEVKVAALSDGGFVVTWEDASGIDGSSQGIIARAFDGDGDARGDAFVVNTWTSSTQQQPAISTYDGGYAIAWSSWNNNGSGGYDIYLQRYANDGTAVGSETLVSTTAGTSTPQSGHQYVPAIASNTSGKTVVAWNDNGGNDGSGTGVFARLYDVSTNSFGEPFLVNTTTAGSQSSTSTGYGPSVGISSDGSFVIVWASSGQDGSGWGVYGQRFAADGSKTGGEFLVNQTTNGSQYQPEVITLSTGGFVVTWYNDNYDISGTGSYSDVYLREYAADGTPVANQVKLASGPTGSHTEQQPAISDLGNGNYVVVYADYESTANGGNNTFEIRQQIFGDPADFSRQANPELGDFTGTVTFAENLINATPQVIDAAVSLTDLDSADFAGGSVELFYIQGGEATDQLSVRNEGTAPGQIGLSGSTVTFGGATIGTLSGGGNGSGLVIALNANATVDAVENLIENLTYASTSQSPAASRMIGIRVSDGDGGASAPASITINVVQELDGVPEVYFGERVNTYTASTQDEPQIAVLADGSYVVVWTSYGQDSTNTDGIYAQRFNPSGQPIGPEFQVNSLTAGAQTLPNIAALSNGGFVITWQDQNGADGSGYGVIGQRYDATSEPVGSNFVVNTTTSSTQYAGPVAAYADGFAVIWSSSQTGGSSFDIYLQRFNNDGTAQGAEQRVSNAVGLTTAQAGAQYYGDIAAQANGNLFVVWNDSGSNDGSGDGVFGRLYDATTATFGSTFLINTTTTGSQSNASIGYEPRVAALADGGYVVVWPDSAKDGSSWGVFGQRFDAAGNPVGTEFRVNEATTSGQYQADVTGLSTGGFVVTWHNDNYDISGTGTYNDTYIREYDAGGQPIDAERKVSSGSTVISSQQYHPAVADLGDGNFVVAYSGYRSTNDGGNNTYEIFQSLFGDATALARTSAAPVLSDLSSAVSFAETVVFGTPQILDPAVSLIDTDSSNFGGGSLELFYVKNGESTDQLGIRHVGNAPGEIGISGNTVSYGGVAIGTVSGGTDGSNLTVSFNAAATPKAVERLIENLTYATTDHTPTPSRTVALRLNDGDGGVSAASTIDINIALDLAPASPVHGEEQVSSYRPSTQDDPQVATLADGSYVVVWASSGQDGSGEGVYGQRFAANGVAIGDEFRINTVGTSTQNYPQVAGLSNGGFVVVWQDGNGTDGSGWGVIGQRYAADGQPAGSNFVTTVATSSTQYHGTVAAYDGGFAVVWSGTASGGNDIFMRRFDNDGAAQSADLLVSTALGLSSAQTGNQYMPDIAAWSNGNLVVVWNDSSGNDGNSDGVFGRIYNAGTGTFGNTFLVNTTTASNQSNSSSGFEPSVSILDDGSFVAVWTSNGQDGSSWGIFGQRFAADGSKLGGEFQINESTAGSQYQPQVTGLSSGGFVVTWFNDGYDQSGSGTTNDVFIREYSSAGAPLDAERKLTSASNSTEYMPAIADLGNGNYVVVYADYDNTTSGNSTYEIKQQLFGSAVDLARSSAAPVIADLQPTVIFTNNIADSRYAGNAQLLDSDVKVTDIDSANFDGGRLVVQLLNGATASETLGVRHEGNGSGQIGLSGSNVQYGGTTIATLSGGSAGIDKLVFSLNANATAEAVQALVENLTYQNSAPPTGTTSSYIGIALSDGDGGVSAMPNIEVRVQNTYAPTGLLLTDVLPSLQISESAANNGVLVDDAVQLDYYNAAGFNGGTLRAEFISSTGRPADQLSIRNQGSGNEQVGVSGNTVSYQGVTVGTIDTTANGANGVALLITFNTDATAEAIERIIENLSYRNTSEGPNESRTLRVTVRDAASTNSSRDVSIQITPEADPAAPAFLFGEQQSNTYEAGQQQTPAVARLFGSNDGGYVVVWRSEDAQDGSGYGVFGQRYEANGAAIGPEFQVNSTGVGNQYEPALAGLQDGGFVVAWRSSGGEDGSGSGVFAQRYDANGEAAGAQFRVNTSTISEQYEPAVLGLADGSFVIVYPSYYSNATASYSYDVLGQRYAADGTPLGGEFAVNTLVSGQQFQPQLAALSTGGFVAIWTDTSGDASGYGIVAQRFAADGSKVGGEIPVNTTTTGTQQGPDVAGLVGGGFVAVWHYNNQNYMQRFDAAGSKVGAEVQVSSQDAVSNYNSYARVAALDDGSFVVTWDSYFALGGNSYDIVAQKFAADGTRIDGPFVVNATIASTQYQPDIAALGGNNFVVAWAGYNQEQNGTANTYGVFHQLLGEAGSLTRSAAPELLDLVRSVTFDEALVNVTPQVIDAGVRVIDSDSANFDGGTLWVSIISGYDDYAVEQLPEDLRNQDQFGIRNQGNAAGEIGIAGNVVSYGGIAIGTLLSSGANGADLVVRFNAAATPAAVEALVENLTYANTSSAPSPARTISISINDGAGGTSTPRMVTINVTPDVDGATPLFAQEQVNTYTPGTQEHPAVATLADGGYVVVWQSNGQDGWSWGIHGQRYDAKGVPVGSEFQFNTYTPNAQIEPKIAGLADGGFVALWMSSGQDGSGNGVFGQRFDANGAPVGAEFQANSQTLSEQIQVDVAALPNGGFVATWYTYYNNGSYTYDVVAQRFDANGAKIGSEITVNTTPTSAQYEPAIASFADNGFIVAWRDDGGLDGSASSVQAQRFAADGSKQGSEFTVNTYTDSNQFDPDVAVLNDGGFVISWTSQGQDGGGSYGVFAQRYNAAGNAVGDEFRVNTTNVTNEYQSSITALSNGGFAVAWTNGSRIYTQQYDVDGRRVDGELAADTGNVNWATQPAIAALDNGAFVVVWNDYPDSHPDANTYGVFQRVFGDPADFVRSANPELVDVVTSVTFRENTINAVPQLIDPGVGLFDADSPDFDGGILEVAYLTGYGAQDQLGLQGLGNQDQLGIRHQGDGTGQVGVSGNSISFEGTEIGTIISDGQNGSKLTVLFNAEATPDAVERVIENLTYANTVSNPIASRTISIRVSDGDGGASVARTVQINVIPEVDGAVPFGQEKVVNTTTANEQSKPAVAVLDDGGYVVVWQSYSQDVSSSWGVYGQRYDTDDNAVGGEFLINTTTANNQTTPKVAALAGGGFVVVWESNGQDGSGYGVYGQRYAADGSTIGSEFRVNTTTSSSQYQPTLTATADGGFVVAWYHEGYSASNTEYADIFFQRYAADGSPAGGETRANPPLGTTFVYQSQPDIGWLADGGFVVVWTDNSTDGSGNGVFGQVFGANGAAAGSSFQVNSYINSAQDTPKIATLKDGGFVVVWESANQDLSSTGIYSQRFDADGAKVGPEFRVNTTISSTQYQPAVTALENGGWVVSWTDISGAGNSYDIFMQQYNAAGQAVDGETRVNSYTPHVQYESAIAAMPDGGFIVAYTGYTYSSDQNGDGAPDGGSDSYDIRLQRFSNTAPEITDVSVSGLEEAVIVLQSALFEAAFSDADGQTLQAVKIVTLPGNGTLRLGATEVVPGQEIGLADLQAGLLTYQGELDFFGLDQFRWTGSDGITFATTPVFTNITLSNVNDGPRLEVGTSGTANEGQWFSRTLTIGDPDPEGHHITVDWGDGSAPTVFSTSSPNPTIGHYFPDDGTYTVTVTANDQQGQANSIETDSFEVVVANVAPTITVSGAATVEQNTVYTIDLGTPYDPAGSNDVITEYRIDWGDGSTVEIYTPATLPTNGILTHTYATLGAQTISVTLVDEDGVHANAGTRTVTVSAPAEVITVNAGSNIGVLEGNFFQKTISFDDPTDQGAAGRSYTVDWGDGQSSSGFIAAGLSSFVIGHTYADGDANYVATVTVNDDGQEGSDSFEVAVQNVAPTIPLGGNASVAEGSAYVLTLGAINDPGADTVQQYIIRWGDGSEQVIAAADLPADRQVSHVYADGAQNVTINVDLIDEDGTWTSAGSRNLSVLNVAPTIALGGADNVNEGSPYTLELGAITDPGQDTVTSYQINWGDGTVETFTAAEIAANSSRQHVYADGSEGGSDYTIFVTLVDEDGTHTNAGNKVVTVNNVAPTLTLDGAAETNEGASYLLSIAASDPAGAADPLTYTIDWGDGSAAQALTAAELAALGGNVAHVFADDEDGPVNATARTITVTVEDGDGGSTTETRTVTVNNVAPTMAVSGPATVDEGSSYTLSLGSLIDPGADTVTAYAIDWGDGNVSTYTPAEFAALGGSASHIFADGDSAVTINVSATDEDGTHLLGAVAVAVENVAPTLTLDGAAETNEGASYLLSIAASDPAGAADPLTYTIDWGDGSAAQALTAAELAALGGNVAHVFADDEDGPVNATTRTITVTVEDGDGGSTTEVRNVTVNNVAPTLTLSGAATTIAGTSYTLGLGAIIDPGTDTVSSLTIDWGDGTSTVVAATGDVSHAYSAVGDYTIQVTVTDEDGSFDVGSLTVGVLAPTPTLSFEAGPDATLNEGNSLLRTINFSDGNDNGDPGWTYTIDYGDGTVVNGATAVQSLQLDHVYADGDASHTVTVTITDVDGETATDSFEVTVNNVAPTMAVSGPASVDEGSTYILSLGSLVDPGADTVTAYAIDWGDGNVSTYTPAEFAALGGSASHIFADGDSAVTINVSATDEDGTHLLGAVAVTVENVAPTLTLDGAAETNEGASYLLSIAASDPAGAADPLTYTIDWGDGSAAQALTAAELAALGGNVAHVFADDEDGPVNATTRTITVTVEDGDGGSTTETRNVTVNNVAPTIAVSGAASVQAGSSYALNLGSIVDPGTDTVTEYRIDWGDGTQTVTGPTATVSHTYSTAADYAISVTLVDEDGEHSAAGEWAVTVTPADPDNTAPVAQNDSYIVKAGQTLTVAALDGLLANDSDADGDALTVISYSAPANGALNIVTDGSFEYTPNAGFAGVETITYTISDGVTTAQASLEITVTNTAPVAQNDSYTVKAGQTLTVAALDGLLANDSDVDGDALTVISYSAPANGALNIVTDGSFEYTPNAGFAGVETITYTISDGVTTTQASLEITVTNTAPVAQNDSYTVKAGQTLTVAALDGLLANDSDVDGDALTVISYSAPANGALNIVTDGSFEYTPNAGFAGVETITYTISDGVTTAQASLEITVTNTAPVAQNDSYTVKAGQTLTVAALDGLLANDSDVDGDALTVISYSAPANGALNIVTDGSFEYTPNAGFAGVETITYTISDGVTTATASLEVVVEPAIEPEIVRIGDAPTRVSSANPTAIADAWMGEHVLAIEHKANVTNAAEAWSAVSFSGVNTTTLAGVDHYSGDLGVSGQSVATSSVRQEIDGTEALRIRLDAEATKVTVDLSRFYLNDEGSVHAESGRLRLLDADGNVVGETVFHADSSTGSKTFSLELEAGFQAIELSAGAYDGTDFVFGGYADAAGNFSTGVYEQGGKLYGSDFLIDWVEFEFQPIGTQDPNSGNGF